MTTQSKNACSNLRCHLSFAHAGPCITARALPYAIVRTRDAGVFAGILEARTGDEALMSNARRLWYWDGAASLSELAVRGTAKPRSCKFPVAVEAVWLLGVIEVLAVTDEARASIEAVPEWSAR